ncbi:succinylglutamate desuccinylase/aspartoacylase family protein [Azospirillum sp. YIM B02556]|uniref:Succinylglutamate desuccinylase/aspartoacylase family protein n=1 Tax=Azospirillum endophyticum TaxID=2800326 RepID=A0ABS1F5G9_9PROT|nr:succinylglutamate desuccinylase/aspartoacylase family protein [Azospirillum endophyticum]MBK1838674.1 succinylglutamate desuccinylase/aspartoacylase family protein [Azospirillum endophyticum]
MTTATSHITTSRITTDVDFERDGFQTGTLRVPHSHDRSAYGHIAIPLAVLKAGSGPTLLLTGGNHGDEYEGPVALMKLINRMPALRIAGRLIVVPGLNFPAYMNGSRTSPIDKGNLNRMFPGARDGTPTQMIAHYVETVLLPLADVALDLHAGGASMNHLPTLLASPPPDRDRHALYWRLVDGFGAPHVMVADLLGEDRTFAAAAERRGKLFLCGEFGGFGTCNPDGLAIVEDGVERLIATLGLLPGHPVPDPRPGRLMRVEGARHYLFAPAPGLFEPAFRLGDEVADGQIAGRLYDPHAPWREPVDLRFRGSGVVVCVRSFAHVQPGDCLVHLASDTVRT